MKELMLLSRDTSIEKSHILLGFRKNLPTISFSIVLYPKKALRLMIEWMFDINSRRLCKGGKNSTCLWIHQN